MSDLQKNEPAPDLALLDRILSILEQARGNVVRTINSNMVMAYWLIGCEIVQELQGGEERAGYREKVIEKLSAQLTAHYGKGFSEENLQLFRRFYLAYNEHVTISYPAGTKSIAEGKAYPVGTESISSPAGRKLPQGFSPQLSWSHYRVLMRVEDKQAREFYEREAIEGGWSKRTLERQVRTQYYDRSRRQPHHRPHSLHRKMRHCRPLLGPQRPQTNLRLQIFAQPPQRRTAPARNRTRASLD
jgi:hypothetical protein